MTIIVVNHTGRQRNHLGTVSNNLLARLKMNRYTFRGNNSVIFIVSSHNKLRSSHKEKNLLPLEQILSFKSGPNFGILRPRGKQTDLKSRNLFFFKNMAEKDGGVPLYPSIKVYGASMFFIFKKETTCDFLLTSIGNETFGKRVFS